MKISQKASLLTAIILGVLTVSVVGWCGIHDFKTRQKVALFESSQLQARIDSLTGEKKAERWLRQAAEERARRAQLAGVESDRRLSALQRRFASLTIPANATPAETIVVLDGRVENLTTQIAEVSLARDSARSEAAEFYQGKLSAERSLQKTEGLLNEAGLEIGKLRSVLAKADPPCKWCPSRTVSFVAGVVLAGVAINRVLKP